MKNIANLSIIVPCFNEEDVLPQTIKTLEKVRLSLIKDNLISDKSSLVFVNDGSKDKTWEIIENQIFI